MPLEFTHPEEDCEIEYKNACSPRDRESRIVAREGEVLGTDNSHDESTAKKHFLSPKSSDLRDLDGVKTIKIN